MIRSVFEDSGFVNPLDSSLNDEEARRLAEAYKAGDPDVIDAVIKGESTAQTPVEPFRQFTNNTPTGFSQVGAAPLSVESLSNVTGGKDAVLEDVSRDELVSPVTPATSVTPLASISSATSTVTPAAVSTSVTAPVLTVADYVKTNPTASRDEIANFAKSIGITQDQINSAFGSLPVPTYNKNNLQRNVIDDADFAEQRAIIANRSLGNLLTPESIANREKVAKENAIIGTLQNQILDQKLTAHWTGEGAGSPEANARLMAKYLADAGITDIKQFGRVPVYQAADFKAGFQGKIASQDENGYYIMVPGGVDSEGNLYNSRQNVDPSQITRVYGKTVITPEGETYTSAFEAIDPSQLVMKNGVPMYKSGEEFGNKETGQAITVDNRRQGGEGLFGGTGAGKGNTGYRVLFGDDGTPYFYTTYASSNDLFNLFADNPILGAIANVAAATFGGPLGVAALQAAQGKNIQEIAKSALLTYVGGEVAKNIAGSQSLVSSVGQNTANIVAKTAGQIVSSGGKADIAQALIGNGLDVGTNEVLKNIDGFQNLSLGEKTFVTNAVKTTIQNGGNLSIENLVNAALDAGFTAVNESKKGVNAEAIKAEETVNNAVNDAAKNPATTEVTSGTTSEVTSEAPATSNLATKEITSSITAPTTTDTITAPPLELPTVKADPLEEIKGMPKFNDAYAAARKLLGPNQVFEWNGKQYSTATAEERPELSGKTTATSSTITNYVTDKLAKNITSSEFNPADLTKDEMAKFVSTYANATDAQKAQLLQGADQMTFKVIDTMLKQTAALNPTGAGDQPVPAGTKELKVWDKSTISTAVDVAKAAGNMAAADIAGLGVRGAQFLGDLMGQDTDTFAGVQNLLVNDKDKSMSKLVGNEKVVAGGIASGIESAVAWTLGGPMAGVATVAGVVANNTWVEGAKEGLSVIDNAKRTAAMTALEVAGEMLGIPGMRNIMKGIPITGSVSDIVGAIKRSGAGMLNEQASELMTTIAQFSVDKFASFGLAKDATFEDFQTALKDTIIATTAAVGTSSGISTATRSASNANTKQIADADRTPVSPDTSLLTSGASFGAKAGDTSNQGVNPISSEAIEFNKLDKSGQTSILDNLRSQVASLGLTAALTLGSVGAIASPVDIDSQVTTSIQSAVDSGTSITTAIDLSVSTSISSAIGNKVSSDSAIDSAVTSAITSAVNNNTSPATAIDSSVSAAINSAVASNVSVNAAVTSAVNSAVTAAINTSVANNTMTTDTVNTAVNSAVNSAVAVAVKNNVNVNTAVNDAVTAAVNAAVTNNVSVADAVNAAVSAVTNLNVNVQAVTAIATKVANDTKDKKTVLDEINTLITPASVTPPVTPPTTPTKKSKPKQSAEEALAGMGGFTFAGSGVIDPIKESFLKTYMTKDSFKDPLEKLREMQGAEQPADNKMMQQQIDPYLASILAERNPTQEQPETEEPQSPPLWNFGQEPDNIDAMLSPKTQPVPEKAFKSGGFVAPLQMASGGAMPLPLLAKAGGLGALPRTDGRMDFRDGAHVAGDGDGQSDDIKAMLADGEFVFPADVVSALGNGSTKAGSDKLYEMMHAIRDRARSAGKKDLPPPALKSPLDYLKKGSKK